MGMQWLFCLYFEKKKKKGCLQRHNSYLCSFIWRLKSYLKKHQDETRDPRGGHILLKKKYHHQEKKSWCCESPTEWVSTEGKRTNCSNEENNVINKTFLISFSFTPQWNLMSSEWKITNQNVLLFKLSKPSENLPRGQLVVFSHEYRATFHINFKQT